MAQAPNGSGGSKPPLITLRAFAILMFGLVAGGCVGVGAGFLAYAKLSEGGHAASATLVGILVGIGAFMTAFFATVAGVRSLVE